MERHLVQDADGPTRKSNKKAAQPLKTADLELVTGDRGTVISGTEEIKPSDSKRFCAVFSGKVAPKNTVAPDETKKKKSAQKSASRPVVKKKSRGSERSLS